MASTPKVISAEGSYDFNEMLCTSAFVDKTLFIASVFMTGRRLLLTAPSKFGKTANLMMLRDFFSIRSADNSSFEIYKNMKISQDQDFFKQHFRSHPVLYLDFTMKDNSQTPTYSHAIDAFKWAIHKAFLDQQHLINISPLSESDKELCRSWCDANQGYKQKEDQDVFNDLSSLVSIMKKAYRKNVVVLIDEYDSIINKSLPIQNLSENIFRDILYLTTGIINTLLRGNVDVSLAVLTGLSCNLAECLLDIDNLEICPFLGKHKFVEFFGITQNELDSLLEIESFKELKSKQNLIKEHYGGYISRVGALMYNTYSVTTCLKSKKVACQWKVHDKVAQLVEFAKHSEGAKMIDKMLKKICLTTPARTTMYSITDILELKKVYSQVEPNPLKSNMLLPYLFELGLLTYTATISLEEFEEEDQRILLKIPNEEVQLMISHQFQSYVVKTCNLPGSYYNLKDYKLFVESMNRTEIPKWKALFFDIMKDVQIT